MYRASNFTMLYAGLYRAIVTVVTAHIINATDVGKINYAKII